MPKVLILYASKKGSTAEVATFLADVLKGNAIEVDVKDAAEFTGDVLNYDAVLIGTPIYTGMWLNTLWNNVRRLTDQLAKVPVWGFALCVRILEEDSKAHIQEHYLPEKIVKTINLQEFKFFAGRVENLTPREVAKFAERYDGEYLHRRGDFRDWDKLRAYGMSIAQSLS